MRPSWVGAMLALVAAVPGVSQTPPRVVLTGNVSRVVQNRAPLGRTAESLPMGHLILSLRMRPEARAQLERLLQDLQDPASPRYHQWLTPRQFGAAFGPTAAEIAQVTGWLASQGFTVEEVAPSGLAVTFTGDAATVEQAFRTPILDYLVDGQVRHANAADPSLPSDLAPLVHGVVGLHNIPLKSMIRQSSTAGAASQGGIRALFTDSSTGWHSLAPADFATIYNVNPLYSQSLTGTGVTIGVIGRSLPANAAAVWAGFRSAFGLPANPPVVVPVPSGATPVSLSVGEDMEANLDVEWAGAVAPDATIKFICGVSANNEDGVTNAALYAVNNNVAPILTLSFGLCEQFLTAQGSQFYSSLWQQAATQGQTVLVASGDSGAADCDPYPITATTATHGLAVNGVGSTPYNISVGGTQFSEGGGTYWSAGNDAVTQASALGYVPENAWNESSNPQLPLASSGGGISGFNPRPGWQVAAGMPAGNYRLVPDVALNAGAVEGYRVWTGASPQMLVVGGTSAATPAFAGLMALVLQKTGAPQGNAGANLYTVSALAPAVFHDIVVGNNWVNGLPIGSAYYAQSGYDLVTGLGSVDAAALVGNWTSPMTFTGPTGSVGLLTGLAKTFSVVPSGLTSSGVAWSVTPATGVALTVGSPSTEVSFLAGAAGTYTLTATSAADSLIRNSLQVQVHAPNLMGTGTAATGMDVLDLLGHFGANGSALDLTGDAVVNGDDLEALLPKLGW